MEELSVKDFIEKVEVKRACGNDCEYEVTEVAMDFYLQYPCYNKENGWKSFLHGNTIANYMRNRNQKHREGYRRTKTYVGAYLLKGDKRDSVLTADILTARSAPIKRCKEDLTEDQQKECECFIKAFETVYYWCGNMMPVICNFSGGRGDTYIRDNWKVKLNLICELSDKEDISEEEKALYNKFLSGEGGNWRQNQLWPGWIYYQWNNDVENFIRGNYLYDYIQNGATKRMVDGTDIDDTNFRNIIMNASNDLNLVKMWFLNNTKWIVQRSYRILKDVQEDFKPEDKVFIKEVFQEIFDKALIPEEQRNFDLV